MKDWFRKFQLVVWIDWHQIRAAIKSSWCGIGYFSWEKHKIGQYEFLDYSINLGIIEIRVWHKGKRP